MAEKGTPWRRCTDGLAKRPAVAAAVLFAAGVAAHRAAPAWPGVWLGVIVGLLIPAVATFGRERVSSAFVAAAVMVGGVAAGQVEGYFYPRDHVSAFLNDEPRLAWVEVSVESPPRVLADVWHGRPVPPKQVFAGEVRRVRTWGGWAGASGRVLVNLARPREDLAVGQVVRVLGRLERPAEAMNPGQFDWAGYCREQRVLATVHVQRAGNIEVVGRGWAGPLEWVRAKARAALAAGFGRREARDHSVLRALLLGDRDPEVREVAESFARTGTSHLLAISGLHVAVVAFVVYGLWRLMRWGPRGGVWAALVVVLVYGVAAHDSPSVVRAVMMCAVVAGGLLMRRGIDGLQVLAISAIAMLVYHPADLYSAAFGLSFGTVAGLMVFERRVRLSLTRKEEDPWRVPDRGLLAAMKGHVWRAAVAGVVAWGVAIPLVVWHFEQINPWAVLGTLVLGPVVFVAIVGGVAKVVLTLLCPWGAPTWAWGARWPVVWMEAVVRWLGHLPGADLPVVRPPVWVIVAYYGLLCLPLVRLPWWWVRRGLVAGPMALAIWLPFRAPVVHGETRVTILAVGAGSCGVVELADGRVVLIDAGSSSLPDALRDCLGPYLRHRGKRGVDAIYLSHPNFDHYSAAVDLVEGYGVGKVYVTPFFGPHSEGNRSATRLLRELGRRKMGPAVLAAGDGVDLGAGARLEVVWPPADKVIEEKLSNEAGMVLRLVCGGRTVLFPADIQQVGEGELVKEPSRIRADVLVAPHHGSSEVTTAAFVRAVGPRFIVSSNDRRLSGKQREFEKLVGRTPLFRTGESGAVTVRVSAEGEVRVETFRGR